jgi:lipid-A-disaccharide synthase-like uncharacterized protein
MAKSQSFKKTFDEVYLKTGSTTRWREVPGIGKRATLQGFSLDLVFDLRFVAQSIAHSTRSELPKLF